MRALVLGSRGSTPAPGAGYLRYGGHTSCIAVLGDDDLVPHLVLDAGTGLQMLTEVLDGAPFTGSILLGHLHWDHTHGLPFFAAGAAPGARVDVLLPDQGEDAEEVLGRAFSPPHFPVLPRALGDGWSFGSLEVGEHSIEGFTVLARDIPHKGGRTFGYRVSDGTSSLAYLSDHFPLGLGPGPEGLGEYHPAALDLCRGVDLVIHDAQHTAAELPALAVLGHSAIEYAIGLAVAAGAAELMLFHHGPRRTDDEIDALVAEHSGAEVRVRAAIEGDLVQVGAVGRDRLGQALSSDG